MAKNTTKKIKELKSDKPEKITNEELNQVQSVIFSTFRLRSTIFSAFNVFLFAILFNLS